jgi:hypothetical protein
MDEVIETTEPTEEQAQICDFVSEEDHLQIVAYAGTGKTHTLKLIADLIPGDKLYVAFNRRIIEEALQGFPGDAKTLNSVGWTAWRGTISSGCQIDKQGKIYRIFKETVKALRSFDRDEAYDIWPEISETITLAKARGYVPDGVPRSSRRLAGQEFWGTVPSASVLQRKIVDEILVCSIREAYQGNCDFDDQLYMPIIFGGSFPKYPTLLVDEEQDLTPVMQAIVDRMMKGARLFTVGDPFQSIYQFRGAMRESMEINYLKRNMAQATLSVSFRCRSRIVENARWRVPGFNYFHEGGVVGALEQLGMGEIVEGSAVVCRNNAPLFRLALNLLSFGRPCRVAGSDIGPKLVGTLKRLGDASMNKNSALLAIDAWAAKKETRADMADCLRIFVGASSDLGEAIKRAEFVLRQDGPITLITGHKSKGLEWHTVYHLDPWLIKDGDDQELNLRYVIQTRAKEAYYEIQSAAIY